MCRDSSVVIASRYGLDGKGIESRWGRDFPHQSIPTAGSTQPPIQWALGLFSGGKAAGACVNHPLASDADVKERVELYFYSSSVLQWTLLSISYYVLPAVSFFPSDFSSQNLLCVSILYTSIYSIRDLFDDASSHGVGFFGVFVVVGSFIILNTHWVIIPSI